MWGVGREGRYAARLFILFSFSRSADHERDWPPCKVVFLGLATNTLNVRNNNNNSNSKLLAKAAPAWNCLEVNWPCAGGLSAVNAIGTQ